MQHATHRREPDIGGAFFTTSNSHIHSLHCIVLRTESGFVSVQTFLFLLFVVFVVLKIYST